MTAKGCSRATWCKGKVLLLPAPFTVKHNIHQNSMWSVCMNATLTQSCSWVGKCSTFCCQLPLKGPSLQSWASASASQHLPKL